MTLMVIALGGNAFIKKGQKGTYAEQYENILRVTSDIADIIMEGYDVVITHGNGPQVGISMLRYEAAKDVIPPYPLFIANAETQGFLGYLIQQSLTNELRKRGIKKNVATIITQVIVDKNDPAFKNPTKPIGPYYSKESVERLRRKYPDWKFKYIMDKGYRRVVPSPDPKEIVEMEIIKKLVGEGEAVIAGGGGGIPVIIEDGYLKGIDAVIDKDLTSELIATNIKAEILLILTDVEGAYINYNKPNQKLLRHITLEEIEKYYNEGHFRSGSMGPKIKAIIRFLQKGGIKGIIGYLSKIKDILADKTGTHITK